MDGFAFAGRSAANWLIAQIDDVNRRSIISALIDSVVAFQRTTPASLTGTFDLMFLAETLNERFDIYDGDLQRDAGQRCISCRIHLFGRTTAIQWQGSAWRIQCNQVAELHCCRTRLGCPVCTGDDSFERGPEA